MRDTIAMALRNAQKEQEKRRISTLRLIMAAIHDRDIALRGKGKDKADEEEVTDILTRMVKQREESAKLYAQGGRADLEQQEVEEIAIIREFLPRLLSEKEVAAAISAAIADTEARSLRDLGKVMAYLKEHHRGQIDLSRAGPMIKTKLSGA